MTSLIALAHTTVLLAANTTTTTSATKSTSSGSSLFLVFIVVIGAAFYFFFMRPQQKKQRAQRQMQSDISEGDEIVTVGGIVGRVIKMDEDRVHVVTGYHDEESAGDHHPHRMTFVRNAVSRKVEPVVLADTAEDDGNDFAFEQDGDEPVTAGNGHGDLSYLENGHVEAGGLDDDPAVDAEDDDAADADAGEPPDQPTERRRRGRATGGGTREGTSQ